MLDVLCSFSKAFAVQNDKIARLKSGNKTANIYVKKLQFIHTVNGDRSKTAKIIKSAINHTKIDIQAMLVWLIVLFMIFAVFDLSLLTVHINCSFFYLCSSIDMKSFGLPCK